jgi:transposase
MKMCYGYGMVETHTVPQEIDWEQMPFSSKEWAQTPEVVQAFVLTLLSQVQILQAEVADLRERVNRNSRNSSQPPSSDGRGVAAKPHRRVKSKRKRGGQPGHVGRGRKLVSAEQLKASYDIKPDTCQRCGHHLEGEDPEPYRHQVAEVPPMKAEVSEYRIHTLTCPECQAETRAELPAGVPTSSFGPRLQAMISLLTGNYHLSKREAVEIMDDFFQVYVSLGSVPALEQRTSQAIQEPVEDVRQYIKTQPAVNADETSWREANQKAWLWVAATTLVTVFLIRTSRGGQVAKEMLGEAFKGILISDRWSAYNWLETHWRQLCWAHLLRDFQAFVERGGESQRIGTAILAQADLMFEWWHKVRDGTMSRATFQQNMQSVQRNVGQLLRQGAAGNNSKTGGTCRDILKREQALWTFVYVEGIEPTNNLGERQVRPGVLWRNTSFGTQSQAGSRFAERIMTVAATLKQQHRNVLDYLTQACDAANWGKPSPSLLPEGAVAAG